MIKENELRIGNYVNAKSPEKTEWVEGYKVDRHLLYYLMFPKSPNAIPIDSKPVPLTEEWLIKFGFKFHNGYGYRKHNFGGTISRANMYWKYNYFFVECLYAHQLQNLYFALTGEELTIKNG